MYSRFVENSVSPRYNICFQEQTVFSCMSYSIKHEGQSFSLFPIPCDRANVIGQKMAGIFRYEVHSI